MLIDCHLLPLALLDSAANPTPTLNVADKTACNFNDVARGLVVSKSAVMPTVAAKLACNCAAAPENVAVRLDSDNRLATKGLPVVKLADNVDALVKLLFKTDPVVKSADKVDSPC